MLQFSKTVLGDLLDSWAIAIALEPRSLVPDRPANDAAIAFATDASRRLFGVKHTRQSARALVPLITAQAERSATVLHGSEVHMLMAMAAADLLERDQLAAFMSAYRESGVDVQYLPVSVTRLRTALDVVLEPYPSAKRLRLLQSLTEHADLELIRHAPEHIVFAPEFLAHYARHANAPIRRKVMAHIGFNEADQLRYARDADVCVRHGLAESPALGLPAQLLLTQDPLSRVRRALAQNSRTFPEVRARLLSDADPEVREVQRLALNPSPRVANVSRSNPSQAAWRQLDHDDQYRQALDGSLPDASRLMTHPAIHHLAMAHYSITNGFAPAHHDVKDVGTLPGIDDLPFPSADEAQRRLATVDPDAYVFRNGRELRANGRTMANCFVGNRYQVACRNGTTVIAKFVVDGVRYNVGWELVDSEWEGLEVEGANLDRDIPAAVLARAYDLGKTLQGMEPGQFVKAASGRRNPVRLAIHLPVVSLGSVDRG